MKQPKYGSQKETPKEIIRRLRIQNKKLMEQVASLREQLKQESSLKLQITNDLIFLQKMCNSLSDALGSCHKCWGEDPDCVTCSGNGSSGWRNINKRLFNINILPALEKVYRLSSKIRNRHNVK